MDSRNSSLPDDRTLQRGLCSIMDETVNADVSSNIRLVNREPNESSSTYPSEVVTCHTNDGRQLRLHCKYSKARKADRHLRVSPGSAIRPRKGTGHEARVYQEVLQPSASTTPSYYGTFHDSTTDLTCLVLEHIDDALKVSVANNGLLYAARWLGHFHRESSTRPDLHVFLEHYDASFYRFLSRIGATLAGLMADKPLIVSDLRD